MEILTPFLLKSHVIQWASQNTSHPDHVCDNHLIASHICELDKRTQERHLPWKHRAAHITNVMHAIYMVRR